MNNGRMTKQMRDLKVFQILSELRCSEVVAVKWNGVDGNVIAIEAEFMKGKRFKKQSHDVFLSPLAKEILDRQLKYQTLYFI